MTVRKTAEKIKLFHFRKSRRKDFQKAENQPGETAPTNSRRNKTKSERKETHSGGGAAPGGSFGRFSGVALCAPVRLSVRRLRVG